MKFKLYSRGAVVAYAFDDRGTVGLRRPDGIGLLRTSADGIPRSVVESSDIADVAAILLCIAENFDQDQCSRFRVEVVS